MAFNDEWAAMPIEEQLEFALAWEDDPGPGWRRVSSIESTRVVLDLLYEIAGLRSTIAVYQEELGPTFDIAAINTSEMTHAEKVADTDGVVAGHPRHAGGWWGLLAIDRTSVGLDEDRTPVRMPPGTSTFHTAYNWLSTTARASTQGMIDFVSGQRAAAGSRGLEHIALTMKYLAYTNADDQFVRYLQALRGHGTEESGHEHHLSDIVALSRDTDERFPRLQAVITLGTVLERFPQVFSTVATLPVGQWDDRVTEHLGHWFFAMGNHRQGQRWLRSELEAARTKWGNTSNMVTELVGSRDTELRVSESLSSRLTTMLRDVTSVRTQLETAYREGGAAERTQALTEARSTVQGWRNSFGSSTTTGVTSNQGSETEVSGDASFDILVADGTVDATETITLGMEEKLESTIDAERETSGSESESTSTTMSASLRNHWESLLTQTRAYERQLTTERSRSLAHTRSVTRVRELRDVDQQVIRVHSGIDQFMRAQGWN